MAGLDARTTLLALTIAGGMALGAGSATAAPQALALVATERPVVLACEGGTCKAEFSAFCLQPERVAPNPGTPYRLTDNSSITLTGIAAGGRQVTLAAKPLLQFKSARTHTAVNITVAQAELDRLGVKELHVTIAENVSLAPAPNANDDNPISAAEMQLVEDALRPVGAMIIDRNSEGMAAARITNRLVNAVPFFEAEPARTDRLWQAMITQADADGLSSWGKRLAQNAFDLCRYYADRIVQGDMRGCMQGQHDRLMKVLNSDYWKAIKTGS